MSDAPTNPSDPRPRTNKEFEDPHYHDEDADIQQDEDRRQSSPQIKKKPPRKLPPLPRRRYEE